MSVEVVQTCNNKLDNWDDIILSQKSTHCTRCELQKRSMFLPAVLHCPYIQ